MKCYSIKKRMGEWNTDTCYNMDENWKQNIKWENPDTAKAAYYVNGKIYTDSQKTWLSRNGGMRSN